MHSLHYEKRLLDFVSRKEGNHMAYKGIAYTALAIAIIGALNWGLVGIFRFNLVALIFGEMTWLSRVVYTLVGICGLYLITFFGQLNTSE